MGQYFSWLNVDRREQLDSLAFDGGLKWCETCWVGAERTEAALTLLSGPWAGDAVMFMGDYCTPGEYDNPLMRRIAREYGASGAYDAMEDSFANVAGRLSVVRGREERLYEGDYEFGPREYVGTFDLEMIHPRYVVNDTRREYVDRERTMVWRVERVCEPFRVVRFDPTPLLLSSGPSLDGHDIGPWLGDHVRATQDRPAGSYEDMSRAYVCTLHDGEDPVFCADGQIRAVLERRPEGYAGLSGDEVEAVRALLRRC